MVRPPRASRARFAGGRRVAELTHVATECARDAHDRRHAKIRAPLLDASEVLGRHSEDLRELLLREILLRAELGHSTADVADHALGVAKAHADQRAFSARDETACNLM